MPKSAKAKPTQKTQHALRVLARDEPKQQSAQDSEGGSGGQVTEEQMEKDREKEEKKQAAKTRRALNRALKRNTAAKAPGSKGNKSKVPSAGLKDARKRFKSGTTVYVKNGGVGPHIHAKVLEVYETPVRGFEPVVWVKWEGYGQDKKFHGGGAMADHAKDVVTEKEYCGRPEQQASGSGSK